MNNPHAITLREALHEYYQKNIIVFSDREISPEAQEFFRCHDVAHVVFGCDTSPFGEGILKLFTIFGTTLGFWKHVSSYNDANAFSLFRQYGMLHVLKNTFRLIPKVPVVILRAKRMSKPWPWAEHSEYLDKPVAEIRQEFNIMTISN